MVISDGSGLKPVTDTYDKKCDKSFFNATIYPIDVIYIKNMVMPMNCYECRFFKQIDTENCFCIAKNMKIVKTGINLQEQIKCALNHYSCQYQVRLKHLLIHQTLLQGC